MHAAWALSLVCEAVCAVFAFRTRYWPRFSLYLAADLAFNLILVLVLDRKPAVYNAAYAIYRVLTAMLVIMAAHEAVSIEAHRRRPGDDSLASIIRWMGLGLGALTALLLVFLVAPSLDWQADHRGAVAAWRVASAVVAGWLSAAWFTGRSLPEPWRPAARHRLWLLAYVVVPMVLSAAMDASGPGSIRIANYIHLGWASACYLIWPVMVARAS